MNDVKLVLEDPANFKKVDVSRPDMYGPGYEVPVQFAGGEQQKMVMYPFANIGIWYKDKLDKPDPHAEAYSYAIWLKGVEEKGTKN